MINQLKTILTCTSADIAQTHRQTDRQTHTHTMKRGINNKKNFK